MEQKGYECFPIASSSNASIYACYSKDFGSKEMLNKKFALKFSEHTPNRILSNQCENLTHNNCCKQIKNEFSLIKEEKIQHAHIIEYYEYQENTTSSFVPNLKAGCSLSMELGICDLQDFELRYKPDLFRIAKAYRQIAEANSYLHSKDIANNDIKPENTLYFGKQIFKVFDLGYSRKQSKIRSVQNQYNAWKNRTNYFLSPELLELKQKEGKIDNILDEKKADVFAFGVNLFYSIMGYVYPYLNYNSREDDLLFKWMCQRKYKKFWGHQKISKKIAQLQTQYGEELVEQFKQLIQATLDSQPEQRPTFDDILDDNFFHAKEISCQ